MNAALVTPTRTRLAAFAAAALTTTVVLGATALGMQPRADPGTVVAIERVAAGAPAAN